MKLENPVGWFEIYVQDMDRAQRFYETVLETTLETIDSPDPKLQMLAFPMSMDKPGCAGTLAKMEGVPSGGNSTLVYFKCDDCGTEAARVQPAGGRVHLEKTAIGAYGFIALAIDTEGNMFGLHSMQ